MLLIRPVQSSDVDGVYALASTAGAGLSTFPASREALAERIAWSEESFAKKVKTPGEEYYLLVLEDAESGDVVGTSAVFATVGLSKPFYNYRLLALTQVCEDPPMKVDAELLMLANDYKGATEMATLYLMPKYRGSAMGRQLSRSRYLLMSAWPGRFAETVMAELRGWVDENGTSPFWEAVGRPFFQMELADADHINSLGNSQFIADLMPKFPIYTSLLSEEARAVIGRPHAKSAAALKILQDEGFRFRGQIDIFDAGPCVEAQLSQIRSVRTAERAPVAALADAAEGPEMLVANPALDAFRVTLGHVGRGEGGAVISEALAEVLRVSVGDDIIYVPADGKKTS